jgi:hypothetical protein
MIRSSIEMTGSRWRLLNRPDTHTLLVRSAVLYVISPGLATEKVTPAEYCSEALCFVTQLLYGMENEIHRGCSPSPFIMFNLVSALLQSMHASVCEDL